MTYNIGGGEVDPARLEAVIDQLDAHVVALQECKKVLDEPRLRQKGWYVHTWLTQCLLSRYPVRAVDARDPHDLWKLHGSGAIIRYEIETPAGVIDLVNVHLATVRRGLLLLGYESLLGDSDAGVGFLEANLQLRDHESELARGWSEHARGPLIVAGDFNLPAQSAIFRRHWSSLTDVFEAVGLGWGDSKWTSWYGARIDHVLVGPGWECLDTWVEQKRHIGLDHRPVLAELRLVGPAAPPPSPTAASDDAGR